MAAMNGNKEDKYNPLSLKIIADILSVLYEKVLPTAQQDDREKKIITDYIKGFTTKDISEAMNLSSERIRQILHNGLEKLKNAPDYDELAKEASKKDAEIEKLKLDYLYGGARKVAIDKARLTDYKLSNRAINCCHRYKIYSISDLVKIPKYQLKTKATIGKKTMNELEKLIKELNIIWPNY